MMMDTCDLLYICDGSSNECSVKQSHTFSVLTKIPLNSGLFGLRVTWLKSIKNNDVMMQSAVERYLTSLNDECISDFVTGNTLTDGSDDPFSFKFPSFGIIDEVSSYSLPHDPTFHEIFVSRHKLEKVYGAEGEIEFTEKLIKQSELAIGSAVHAIQHSLDASVNVDHAVLGNSDIIFRFFKLEQALRKEKVLSNGKVFLVGDKTKPAMVNGSSRMLASMVLGRSLTCYMLRKYGCSGVSEAEYESVARALDCGINKPSIITAGMMSYLKGNSYDVWHGIHCTEDPVISTALVSSMVTGEVTSIIPGADGMTHEINVSVPLRNGKFSSNRMVLYSVSHKSAVNDIRRIVMSGDRIIRAVREYASIILVLAECVSVNDVMGVRLWSSTSHDSFPRCPIHFNMCTHVYESLNACFSRLCMNAANELDIDAKAVKGLDSEELQRMILNVDCLYAISQRQTIPDGCHGTYSAIIRSVNHYICTGKGDDVLSKYRSLLLKCGNDSVDRKSNLLLKFISQTY